MMRYGMAIVLTISTGLGSGLLLSQSATAQSPNCRNPQTQTEMNICAGRDYQNADRKLNQVYRQLLPKLQGTRRQKLISAQQAWIRFRDASCTFERTQAEGGTMEPMLYSGCLTKLTEVRTKELSEYLELEGR